MIWSQLENVGGQIIFLIEIDENVWQMSSPSTNVFFFFTRVDEEKFPQLHNGYIYAKIPISMHTYHKYTGNISSWHNQKMVRSLRISILHHNYRFIPQNPFAWIIQFAYQIIGPMIDCLFLFLHRCSSQFLYRVQWRNEKGRASLLSRNVKL